MGRKKAISTEELIRFADEYYVNNPITSLNSATLGKFIRTKEGYSHVQDTVIRRNTALREYLDMRNDTSMEKHHVNVSTFHSLDVEKFMQRYSTPKAMMNAIVKRDMYYSSVASSAAEIFDENRNLEKKCATLKADNDILKSQLEKKEITEIKNATKEKNKIIKALNSIIKTYVQPEIANNLLKREGILEPVTEIVDGKLVEENLITADSTLDHVYNSEVVRELSEYFNKD